MALAGGVVVAWGPVGGRQADQPVVAEVREEREERAALVAARRQGTKVEVAGLKTENARFFANPGGTMTMEQSVVPERVRRDGGWVELDPRLGKRSDGSFAAKAATAEVVFSGGGAQPFARLTAGAAEIALTWPRPLPAPVVSGDTATYPEVLPGVDLRARSGREGFGHELVVKTRAAAADPALARIAFGLTVKGVRLSTDAKGALRAVNAEGATVFSAPAASMWDGAERTAAVGVAVGGGELVLTPDRALLTDPAAKLPITIDPQYSYHSPRTNGWSLVRSGWPGTPHWNRAPEDDRARYRGVARIGVSPEDGNGSVDRAIFGFDAVPLRGTLIKNAQFLIKQGWKWANTCDFSQVPYMDLHVLNYVGPDTTWNNQPAWHANNLVGSGRPVFKSGETCGPNWAGFDIKAQAQAAASEGWTGLVLGLKDRAEAGVAGWKRFYVQTEPDGGPESYPHLTIEYNHFPDDAVDLTTDPVLKPCTHCAGKSYLKGDRVLLKGRITDQDGGSLQGGVFVYGPQLPKEGKWLDAGQQHSGSTFAASFDLSDKRDGDTYSWSMAGNDGWVDSKQWKAGPSFVIDRTPPAIGPKVESALYRPDNAWHGGPGVADKFYFMANGVDDVDHYLYSFTDPPNIRVNASRLGGDGDVTLAPPVSGGPATLFVRSVDKAGHVSPVTQYRFYVRAGVGPKSLWPLDGHTRDEADLGDRDATRSPSGSNWTDAGAVGSAVALDGVHGQLTAPHTVRTDTSFSVSAWVRLDPGHTGHNATAVSQLGTALPGFQLSYLDNNSWGFGIRHADTAADNDFAASPAGLPQPGAWTHLAGVYDAGVNTLRLYVNGTLVRDTQRNTALWNAFGEVQIGRAGSLGQHWKGGIDEVRLYDRALLGNEVRALVGLGNVQAGQWKFDEDSGTTAANNVPGGTPMTLRSGARFAPGAVGNGVRLDGANDTVRTGESVLRTDQSFAVTAWVRQDRAGPDESAFAALSQDADRQSGFWLGQRQVNGVGRWELYASAAADTPTAPGAQALSSTPSKLNTWTHLTGVFDRPAEQIKLYVDGVLAATAPWKSYNSSSGSLVAGAVRWNNVENSFWPGGLDEIRAYSRVLDEAEIRGIIAADGVPTGSWKLDGGATDDSGSARDGTAKGDPAWVPGQSTTANTSDQAVRLDGVDDHISTPNAVDTTRSYAVSAWLKPAAANAAQTAIAQDGADRSGFALHTTAEGKWAVTAVGTKPVTVTGGSVQPNVWTHVVAVHDQVRKEISLHLNGVAVGAAAFDGPLPATGEFQIGRGQSAGRSAEFFRGDIDDVRTYQRILFEDEIRANAGRDLSLVHNLKLDETGGGTAADSVGPRGGTLHGGAAFEPGRSGNAVKLNGVDGAVSTTGIDVRTEANFTVSAWVNLQATEDGETTAVSLDGGKGVKFRLGHKKDRRTNAHGTWIFEMPEQNGTITQAALSTLPTEIGPDKWTHLTGVYDARARKVWLYVNGKRVGDGTLVTPWSGAGGLQLGRAKQDNGYGRHWPGRLDDVRVYTGGLNGDRVKELVQSYGPA
ncbi:hypothetical protein GCM10010452_21900 [Crossiella cryophila]